MWLEDQIARDHDPHREARPDRERRRDVQLALDDGLARTADRVLRAVAYSVGDLIAAILAGFEADIEDGREARGSEQLTPVIINPVFEPGVSCLIGAGLALEDDGSAIG